MAKAKFNNDGNTVVAGKDGIIVRKYIAGLEGGRALDLDGYALEVIPCGTPIASKTASGVTTYKPVPPKDVTASSTTTYGFNLPSGFAYVGIASATVKAGLPVPVVMSGVINETAMLDNMKEMFPSSMETPTALAVPSALKTACPNLIFMSDEANDVPSHS